MSDKTWSEYITVDVARTSLLEAALGSQRDFKGWLATTRAWIETNPDIHASVSAEAIVAAYTSAAKLGLMVDGEECMVMTRGRGEKAKIRCEIGAKGVIRKAGQAGIRITRGTVREGDTFTCNEATGDVNHQRAIFGGDSEGAAIGYYAIASHRDGTRQVSTLSIEEARKRERMGGPAWKTWFDEMAEKSTVLKLGKELYYGDEIEALMSASGVTLADTWLTGDQPDASSKGYEEPTHPPQSASDKVRAAAARVEQDDAAEASQEAQESEHQEEPVATGPPQEEEPPHPGENSPPLI